MTPDTRPPSWDTPNAFLLLAALGTVTARLTATEWVPHLERVQALTLLGGLLGLALGYSRFRPAVTRFFNLTLGTVAVIWQLGQTLPAVPYWAWKVALLGERWRLILPALLRREDITDPLFFLTLAFLTAWGMSSAAAYLWVRTGNAWNALLLPGILLFGVHISDKFWPYRAWYLGMYAFLSLLIIARAHYLHNRRRWMARHTRLPAYLGVDITRSAVLLALLLLFVSWMTPSVEEAVPAMQQTWETATSPLRERFRPWFASLRATVGVVSDYYGETLSLGLGQPLSDAVVMTVQAPAEHPAGVRFYWRARVYDLYTENTWESTLTEEAPIAESIFLDPSLNAQPRWRADLLFTVRRPFGTIHVVPQPVGVDRPGRAHFARNPDGSLDIGYLQADPLLNAGDTYTVRAALTAATIADLRAAGREYPKWVRQRYLELPPDITPRTLALARQLAAGRETPYDIAETVTQYLRGAIAYQTTIDAPPKGQEVVDWLLFDYRKGFCNYYATAEVVLLRSLGIPARLAVGYAQGEYRAITPEGETSSPGGVPESGQNPPGAARAAYIVRQKDLHAWPEVYFPGIGWVEFEPTANQDPILRLSGEPVSAPSPTPQNRQTAAAQNAAATPTPEPPPLPPAPAARRPAWLSLLLRLAAALGAFLLLFLLTPQGRYFLRHRLPREIVKAARRLGISPPARWESLPEEPPEPPPPLVLLLEARLRRWGIPLPKILRQWAAWARLTPQARAWQEVNRALRRLGAPPLPADTPAERAARLSALLPEARQPTQILLETCHRICYAPPGHPLPPAELLRQAARRVRSLSRRARLERALDDLGLRAG